MRTWMYNVLPNLPERLAPLRKIAYNLWFSWSWEAVQLFMRLGREYWEQSYQNPVRMLGMIPQDWYEKACQDDSFLASMDRLDEAFEQYMSAETWYQKTYPDQNDRIAYFSFEYGLDEGLPIYSGGLGILAGDHLKSASDLGLPLCAVGLLYRQGYFRQYLNADGYQQEEYPENDWYTMPVNPVLDANGAPVKIRVDFPDGPLAAQVWRVQVGRVPLYLLDTNIPENSPAKREVTAQLYGGDGEMRIRQEILLGIGGVRALWAMGIEPAVCHINEGHSAFLAVERIARACATHQLSFEEARELVWASSVFTTHTPVPAGNERFDPALVERYLKPYFAAAGLTMPQALALGRENPADGRQAFCMTVLALRLAAHCNAVSRLHGGVSRRMWKDLWPNLPLDDIPIRHITNGIHTRGWLSHDMLSLFERYLGPRFVEEPTAYDIFRRIDEIPDAELWRTHERRRERMVGFARKRLIEQYRRSGAPQALLARAEEALDPETLTIGFARRFATYKRGTLLFRDPARLDRILNHPEHPVQIVFAGKSHPHDEPGKALIREIAHWGRDPRFQGKIIFIADYDIAVGRYLTQGVDVWLNTPRRPLEASGTSGMKAAVGGALNVSILDGWWDEAYAPENGWAIGLREEYTDYDLQDRIESEALYDLLEQEVVPAFYKRGRDGVPREWVKRMKASMRVLGAFFNTSRMVQDYAEKMYLPAMKLNRMLSADGAARARTLSAWKIRVAREWPLVKVESVESPADNLVVGACMAVKAVVRLGALTPGDVSVELFYGSLNSRGELEKSEVAAMSPGENNDGLVQYTGCIPCERSGRFGFGVRVLPRHEDLYHPYLPGLVYWAD
ncbi:MAG: alpha-glucan family phosphorylase [Planctomycetota bacterium]